MADPRPLVPFLDVGATYRELRPAIDAAVHRVLASGRYILGEEVEAFEAEYAAFVGARHAVGVANGLDALELALRALGCGPGDEVIVPANTYIATWLAVSAVGAVPVPVEPDLATRNLDPAAIEAAITPRTRGLLPVHLYGSPVDLQAVGAVAQKHALWVVDDAAQAHGAAWNGRRIGALANVTAWSFYPGKNLGAFGDGGAVTTDDPALADTIRTLRNYGSRVKYHNEAKGTNSRLDPIQAAILRVKLPHLDDWNRRRDRVAATYAAGLGGLDAIGLPSPPPAARSVWHQFVITTDRRDELRDALAACAVETMIHYPIPPHLQPAYADAGFGRGSFPASEYLHDHVLSLPIGPHLSEDSVARVVEAVAAAVGTRG